MTDPRSDLPQVYSCLWFGDQAEEAVAFYTSLIPGSRITQVLRHRPAGPGPEGGVLAVTFELAGRTCLALNGARGVPFTMAHSMVVECETQAEIDRLWAALLEGGTESQCGWLADRWGVSWQIVPAGMVPMLAQGGEAGARVMAAMMKMIKLDIATLKAAERGDNEGETR